ncbi:MAG: SGNH/GDSL hydrolase family protein [Bacilli bacterium]
MTATVKTTISKNIPHARKTSPAAAALAKSAVSKQHKLTVMAVGGSSAQGYDAPKLDGYLTRALSTVSSTLNIPISFVNKAKSGEIPTMLAPQYDPLLYAVKPNVVIISWGLLNTIARKVPEDMFQRAIQSEVSMAIKFGADVWIVTPPVTPATYVGHDVELERVYAYREILGARAVHSTHVHVFELLNAMKTYLRDHHQSYKPYASNNWHMNQAGHVLAGHILADAILRRAKSIGLTS